MAERQLSPLELLMSALAPAQLAMLAPQFASQAMRPALPPSTSQMEGNAPYRPVAGATPLQQSSASPTTLPNSDVTLEAINKRLPAGKGVTLGELTRLLSNLQGPSAAY